MKGCASLLLALLVLAALLAGGWWLYTAMGPGGSDLARIEIVNETAYGLTLRLTKDVKTVSVVVGPGTSATRELEPGAWRVEGSLAEPGTRPFAATWELAGGEVYGGRFRRETSGDGGSPGLIAIR